MIRAFVLFMFLHLHYQNARAFNGENILRCDVSSNDSIDNIIRKLIKRKYWAIIQEKTYDLDRLARNANKLYGENGEEVVLELLGVHYYVGKQVKEWFVVKRRLEKRYRPAYDAITYNNDAWFLFKNSQRRRHLKTALRWSRAAVALEPTANWIDTYANLLYKLGKKDKALYYERVALEKDPKNEEIELNLKKMLSNEQTWL